MALGIGSLQEQTNRAMTAYAGNQQALDADINKAAKNPRIAPDIAKLAAKSTMDKLLTSLENANLAASMPSPTPTISDQLDSSLRQRLENLINKNAPATQNTMVGNAVATLNNKGGGKGIMGNSPQQGMNVPQPKQTQAAAPPLSQQAIAQRPAQGIMSAPPQQGMPTRMAAGGGVMKYAGGDMVTGDFGASTPEMLANMTQEQLTALANSIGISVTELLANISPVISKGGNAETVTNLNTGKVTEEPIAPKGIETVASEPMPRILREVADPKATAPKGVEAAASSQTDPNAIGNILAYAQEREARKKRANDSKSVMPSVTPEVKDKYGMTEEERRLSRAELLKATAPQGIETAVAPNALPSQDAVSAPEGVELFDLPAAALKWLGDNKALAASIGLAFIPGVGWGALAARGGIRAVAAGVSRLSSTKIGNKAKEALLDSVSNKIRAEGQGNIIGLGGSPVRGYTKGISRERRNLDPQKLRDRASDAVQLGAAAVLGDEILGGEDPVTPIVPLVDNKVLNNARNTNGVATNGVATKGVATNGDAAFEEVLKALQAERDGMATGNKGDGGGNEAGVEGLYIPQTPRADSPDGRLLRKAMVANTDPKKQANDRLAALKASDLYYKRAEKDKRARAAAEQRQKVLDADIAGGGDEFGALLRGLANTGPMQNPSASGARNLQNYRTTRKEDLQKRQEAIQDLISTIDKDDTKTAEKSDTSAQNTLNRAVNILKDAATFVASLDRTEQSRLNTQSANRAQAIIAGRTADRADSRAILSQTEAERAAAISRQFEVLLKQEANLQARLDGIAKFKADYAAEIRGSDYYQEQKRIIEANNPGSSERKEADANIDAANKSIEEDILVIMNYLEAFGTVESIIERQGVVGELINKSAEVNIPPLLTGTGGSNNTTNSDNARVDANVSKSLGE